MIVKMAAAAMATNMSSGQKETRIKLPLFGYTYFYAHVLSTIGKP